MGYVTRLHEAVKTEIASGRLGTPVFARLGLAVSADHGHLLELVAQSIELCGDLLGFPVGTIRAAGSLEKGHVSVQVDLAAGKSALVSASALNESPPWFDLFLLGNHGSVSHAPPREILSDELSDGVLPLFGASAPKLALSKLLATSLKSGEVLRVRAGKETRR